MNTRKLRLFLLDLLEDDRHSKYTIPMISISLAILAASVIFLFLGKNPLTAFKAFLQGSGLMMKPAYAGGQNVLTDFLSFLGILAPMILASLGVILGMKTGLFNIGVSGQMMLAGFMATIIVGYSDLNAWIARPLVIVIGVVSGAAIGAFIGFLKYRFNIHEVVSSIMINYIISYLTGFFINNHYIDMFSRMSLTINDSARLTITGLSFGGAKLGLPIGIVLALIMVLVVRFILERTVLGFEMKAVGLNRDCARYAGMRVGANIMTAMLLSGMCAGLAGVTYYLGYFNTIVPKELASLGYDSISAALLGNISPIGAVFSSFLITIFQRGSVYMSSAMDVPKEIAGVITGVLLLLSACGAYIRRRARMQREQLLGKNPVLMQRKGVGGNGGC